MNFRSPWCVMAAFLMVNGCASKTHDSPYACTNHAIAAPSTKLKSGVDHANAAPPISILAKAFAEVRLTELKTQLNLTPKQEVEIQAILSRRVEQFVGALTNIFQGTLSSFEDDKVEIQRTSLREQIKPLLTAEQLAAYDNFLQEQLAQLAREMAAARLTQLQTSLQLETDQLAQVFAVLKKQAFARLANETAGTPLKPPSQIQSDDRVEALSEVLTPEQVKRYQLLRARQKSSEPSFIAQIFWIIASAATTTTSLHH